LRAAEDGRPYYEQRGQAVVKYVFITGGVASSLGKGIAAASLGRLLGARGWRVSMQKMDPYYNIDQGLLSPLQRGEIYITDDGTPTDRDIGHFERFTGETLQGAASVTTGLIHRAIMEQEQQGAYRGATIQMVPHVTDEIKRRIICTAANSGADIAIIEIGGTVGDMEGAPFLEAIRQMKWEQNENDCCFIHVTYLPTVGSELDIKTKPTQHSVKTLRSLGIQPNLLVCRCDTALTSDAREKIALFCNVTADCVIEYLHHPIQYETPLAFEREGMGEKVLYALAMPKRDADLKGWIEMVVRAKNPEKTIRIGLVGKYLQMRDAYRSVVEALRHAGTARRAEAELSWIPAQIIESEGVDKHLAGLDAIIAPGGHGRNGAEGIIQAADYAYMRRIPFLAIGYGMQLSLVAAARSLLGLPDAHSAEINPMTSDPIVRVPKDRADKTGSERSRMGGQGVLLSSDSLLARCYEGKKEIRERHGNRFEINHAYVQPLSEKGIRFPAIDKAEGYIEAFERPDHPFYIGVLYHPEYISRPDAPHPLFDCFIDAACKQRLMLEGSVY